MASPGKSSGTTGIQRHVPEKIKELVPSKYFRTPSDNPSNPESYLVDMHIDMALAASYKPVLVCIGKICLLMIFHYGSVSILFVTERYAVIIAALYIDHWLAYEYIINTNSFAAVLALSLLVHELRDAGVQERLHGEISHTVLLSILMACNILVLVLGENQSFMHLMLSASSNSTLELVSNGNSTKKTERVRTHQSNSVPTFLQGVGGGGDDVGSGGFSGTLMYVLLTCTLLVLLSTCAMPVSIHDPVLNNIRVWSFAALSMIWLYTVNYKHLRYSVVASFTPCILRFSAILFLTPTPFAIGGVFILGVCVVVTHSWQYRPQNEMQPSEQPYQSVATNNHLTSVVRDASPGCVISYRPPSAPLDKTESHLNNVSSRNGNHNHSTNTSNNTSGSGGGSIIASVPNTVTDIAQHDNVSIDIGSTEIGSQNPAVDYNSLFEQVLSEQNTQP